MVESTNCNSKRAAENRSIRFVVAAKRRGGLHYVADFSTLQRAETAIEENMDRDPLVVVCAEVWRASNGNIRLWQCAKVEVLVEVVDPTEGLIGGDDIDTVPATLNLATGEVVLDNPKRGHPLLSWSDTGTCIMFNGSYYNARILKTNLPCGIWGQDIADFICKHGYTPTINLATLAYAGSTDTD